MSERGPEEGRTWSAFCAGSCLPNLMAVCCVLHKACSMAGELDALLACRTELPVSAVSLHTCVVVPNTLKGRGFPIYSPRTKRTKIGSKKANSK